MPDNTRTPEARDDAEQAQTEQAQTASVVSGTDLDSRKRAAKHALAAAETTGNSDAADAARKELDEVNEKLADTDTDTRTADKDEAATQRKASATTGTRTTSPQGRTAAPKDKS